MLVFKFLEKYYFVVTGVPKTSIAGLTTNRISAQSNKLSSSNTSISSIISGN